MMRNIKRVECQQYIIILLRIFIFPKSSLPLQQENINTNNMENKNIKRINETLKEIAEAQQDTEEFNRDIEMDIDKINQALLYGDLMQREESRCDIVRKYPNYAHYLDNRAFLLNLIVYDPTIILRLQKIALINMKSRFGFSQGLNRGAKLGVKWRIEDIQDSRFGK